MMNPETHEPQLPSRRAFLALGVGAFVVATVPMQRSKRRKLTQRSLPVMGTIAEFGVVHDDARYAQAAIDAAFAELSAVDRAMTRFSTASEIGRANVQAAHTPAAVGAPTAFVLAAALHWAHATDGGFDPCLGGAVVLWDVGHRHAPPPAADVRRFANRQLYRALELDRQRGANVVRFHEADIALDLGGIAKGYAVDRAVATLREWGIRNAIVNVGGDLYALGHSPEGDPWEVGVRSPSDPARIAGTLRVSDRAVATSGDYEQFFEHDSRRYHHLLDSVTAQPRTGAARTLTVAADDCLTADAAATALFGRTPADAHRALARIAPHAEVVHFG